MIRKKRDKKKADKKDKPKKAPKKAKPKKAKPKKAAPAPRPVSTRGSCRFVCSECYAEFMLPANFSQEALTCPECLHVGKRPDQDFLRTVLIHKGQEQKSLMATVLVGAAFVLASLLLVWQTSLYSETELIPSLPLLGLAGLLFLGFLGLLYRFENNRWEVYF